MTSETSTGDPAEPEPEPTLGRKALIELNETLERLIRRSDEQIRESERRLWAGQQRQLLDEKRFGVRPEPAETEAVILPFRPRAVS
jgi:hypothetical protein